MYLRIFFHFTDVCLINAWLLYRRDCQQLETNAKDMLSLYQFKARVSEVLRKENQPVATRPGRPSTPVPEVQARRGRKRKQPQPDTRYDQVGHFPGSNPTRKRCKNGNCKGKTTVYCIKYKLNLCLQTYKKFFFRLPQY